MRDRPTRRNSEAQKHRRMNIFALPSRRNPGAVLLERKNKASKTIILLLAVTLAVTFWAGDAAARFLPDGIYKSKHNLSASGPGPIKALDETRVCVFCHTPHEAEPAAPLWNHDMPKGANYTTYGSSTLKAQTVGQPTGPSRLCLSCHDGSIALGAVGSEARDIDVRDRGIPITTLPAARASNLTTDLSDDHPISFSYARKLYGAARGQLADPSNLTKAVRLYKGKVECTTCHEAHDDKFGKFLVMNNMNSALCLTCHTLDYWVKKPSLPALSSHKTSVSSWNGFDENPWTRTAYLAKLPNSGGKMTVQLNGCANCHSTHAAKGAKRLLNYAEEEDNCLPCHNGNVGSADIATEFGKEYSHPIYENTGAHDPTDDLKTARRHVECVDCHNHHAAQSGSHAEAEDGNEASPVLEAVWGVEPDYSPPSPPASGEEILRKPSYSSLEYSEKEYQICFKCHSSYAFGNSPPKDYTDQGEEFNVYNFSTHPVVNPGTNSYCNSSTMEPPWNQSLGAHDTMYCSDCHASDDPNAPPGPHGSDNEYMLRASGPGESYDNLCILCHKASVYIDGRNGSNFEEHGEREHLYDSKTNRQGCMACHAGKVGNYGGRTGNIHGTNYQWPDHQGKPGLTSDNMLVGGYNTAIWEDAFGRYKCMSDSNGSGAGDGSHCHMEEKSWP